MLKIDLHIHTVASRHAHNTILEYINQAKILKMKVIGISDHGPSNSSTLTDLIYFKELRRIPEVINGVRVLKGAEANIISRKGEIDISDKVIETLDYVMAGLHSNTPYPPGDEKDNTEAVINTIMSGKASVITHPFINGYLQTNIKQVSEAACKHGVLLELNLSYLYDRRLLPGNLDNLKIMIDIFRRHDKKIIVNSDSHNIWELGDDTVLKKYKKQIGLTDDLIINNYPKELLAGLGLKK